MSNQKSQSSANPEHNKPPYEDYEELYQATKARLYKYHENNGTLGLFYELYPASRPLEKQPDRGGRSR